MCPHFNTLQNIGNDDPDLACKDGDGAVDQTLDFAWLLMNLGAVRHVQSTVHTFIALTGIDVMGESSMPLYTIVLFFFLSAIVSLKREC